MKKIILILFLVVLISLVSFSANAATTDYPGTSVARFDFGRVGDGLRGGLNRIEDFFSGGWQNYEKTVIFVIFFFLFFSAYLIGMKKSMAGELTRAHTTFAFTAAFLSSFIIVITLRFDWVNLEYVAWFLIAVLILFMIYSLLVKLGLEKHKFWAFILALLITALLLWLIWYLMNEGRSLEGLGKVNDWFKDISKRAKMPGGGAGPSPKPTPVTPITPPPTGPTPWYKSWLIIILVIVLVTHGVAGGIGRRRGRGFWRGIGDMYGLPGRGVRWARWRYANRQLRLLINAALRRMAHRRLTVVDREEILRVIRLAQNMIDRLTRGIMPTRRRLETLRRHINTILARRGVRTI